jgi:hypothetical protein
MPRSASTRDLSTMEAYEGARIAPYAALTMPLIEPTMRCG